jgi:CYTH domain-containing protein
MAKKVERNFLVKGDAWRTPPLAVAVAAYTRADAGCTSR